MYSPFFKHFSYRFSENFTQIESPRMSGGEKLWDGPARQGTGISENSN